MNFSKVYSSLNSAQKEAVDTIEGPVLVLAGPGTGKTQLLTARIANILQKTDTDPANILCLTYTDAGVTAMRQRLAQTIGSAGFLVNIHTFHSFALEAMRLSSDHFLDLREFKPIDDLTSYQILEQILYSLPQSYKLKHRSFSKDGNIKDLTSKIAELKNAGLNPEDAHQLHLQSIQQLDQLSPLLELFPDRIPTKGPKLVDLLEQFATELSSYPNPKADQSPAIQPIGSLILSSLSDAILSSSQIQKSNPLTAWKNSFTEKDSAGKLTFKDYGYLRNLKELAHVYKLYQQELAEREYLEFSDMILSLVKALKTQPDLRYNLQERYQYIMVDEFQDTSLVQLELVNYLTDSPALNGSPNLMAVGDDDQAIYAFQGANVGNIQKFLQNYPASKIIQLSKNYRSSKNILTASQSIAGFIQERPSGTKLKILDPANPSVGNLPVKLSTYSTQQQELQTIANAIKQQHTAGDDITKIAVISTRHKHLEEVSSYLLAEGIPVTYDKSSNILNEPIIQDLLSLSSLIFAIASGDFISTKHLVAEVISQPYWGVPKDSLWLLAQAANQQKKNWLQLIQEGELGPVGVNFFNIINSLALLSNTLSLEQILDLIIGQSPVPDLNDGDGNPISSPFKSFYFSEQTLLQSPTSYVDFLASLSSLRDHLRKYYPDRSTTKLKDLLEYTRLCAKHGGINLKKQGLHTSASGVNLLTAYSSKGLEFDTVYIIHANDNIWGTSSRSRSDTLKIGNNFEAHSDSLDDKTRLFYVAGTRAQKQLLISNFKFNEAGKEQLPCPYFLSLQELATSNPQTVLYQDLSSDVLSLKDATTSYQKQVLAGQSLAYSKEDLGLKMILRPLLESFRLSPTSLNAWLELKDEPTKFIESYLLRFPSAMSLDAIHGSCTHKALEVAQLKFNLNSEVPSLEQFLQTYQDQLQKTELSLEEKKDLSSRAEQIFTTLYPELSKLISQNNKPEESIQANFDEVRLSGKLDAISFGAELEAAVLDYKTGKPQDSIKDTLRNQLYFYRLLLELRSDYLKQGGKQYQLTKGSLIYLSPSQKELLTQTIDYQDSTKERQYQDFKSLVKTSWNEIMDL
jgi:DNA helicase-2/ATP-dependent DNA helicase PcrA